jgi:hypothetical protein
MAVMELGSFSNASTGNTTINLNGIETPTYIDFWCGPRSGTTESASLYSIGAVDITNGNATYLSTLADDTHNQTKSGTGTSTGSSCLVHYAVVAGVITKVVEIKFVSAASGSFVVNYLTASSVYDVFCRVYG